MRTAPACVARAGTSYSRPAASARSRTRRGSRAPAGPPPPFSQAPEHLRGPRDLGRVLLVGDGGRRAAVSGVEPRQVATDLARADGEAPVGQGRAQLPARPGAALGEQLAEGVGDLLASGGI